MARALVLGATGHLGAHIVRALLAEGHEVRATYRSERFIDLLDGLPVERVHLDLEQPGMLRTVAKGCEWVFHAAGYYPSSRERREQAIERGILSTRRALEQLAEAQPSRIVFTSSASTIRHVEGRAANEVDAESWPLSGSRSLYATVKIAMEHEALSAARAGLPIVIVNPSICVGEYDAHALSGRLILAFAKYRVPCYLDQWLNLIYTGDVGVGHLRAATRGHLGERYLLTTQHMTLQAFTQQLAQVMNVTPPRWRLPHGVALTLASLVETVGRLTRTEPLLTADAIRMGRIARPLDGTKAMRELSLPSTPIDEAIRRAVAWFTAHGMLSNRRRSIYNKAIGRESAHGIERVR